MKNRQDMAREAIWREKEYRSFVRWTKYCGERRITVYNAAPLMERYLSRLTELGCEKTAVDIIRTALSSYIAGGSAQDM